MINRIGTGLILLCLLAMPLTAHAGWKEDYRAALSKNDHRRALEVVQTAVSLGDAEAEFTLGLIYHAGQGVPRDDAQAHAWMRVGMENGFRKGAETAAFVEEKMSPEQREKARQLADGIRAKRGRR